MIDRRTLLLATAALGLPAARRRGLDLAAIERGRVLGAAQRILRERPRTITAVPAPRSPGGAHDYYSEADYWWPDPARPGGPYIRRDGFTNPAKFDGHRDALIAVGRTVPTLAAAWLLTRRPVFAHAAAAHVAAWFVDAATRMNPTLAHAQAIIGRDTGRAIGIIDTLQLVEVARAARRLGDARAPGFDAALRDGVHAWFAAYLAWLTTSPAGEEERDQANNHGTCWLLQVAVFADLVGDEAQLAAMRERLVRVIVPRQIARDGSQPLELARTKPFGYSLFNLDVLAAACQLLAAPRYDPWRARGGEGGSVADAITFMAPFIRDRGRWPFAHDVEHWASWPVRQPALLFGGLALDRADWLALWRTLAPDPADREVVRNFPVRQPLLWVRG